MSGQEIEKWSEKFYSRLQKTVGTDPLVAKMTLRVLLTQFATAVIKSQIQVLKEVLR